MAGLAAFWTMIAGLFWVYCIYSIWQPSKFNFLKIKKTAVIYSLVMPFIWFFVIGILALSDTKHHELQNSNEIEDNVIIAQNTAPKGDPIFENDSDLKKIDRRIKGVIADGDTLVIHFQMLPEDIGGITEALTPAKYISIYANDPIVKSAKKIRFVAFNELGNRFGEFTFAGSILRQKSFTKMRYDEIADTAENIILTDFGKTSAILWCEDHQSKKICSEN